MAILNLGRGARIHPSSGRGAHRGGVNRRRAAGRAGPCRPRRRWLAASTHFTKAGTRAIANTSPEPFSNWILSLSEDGFVIALAVLALTYPLIAAVVVLAGLAVIIVLASWLIRGVGRRVRRAP
jgi:hypothetical protein